jgi:hypothetical protein
MLTTDVNSNATMEEFDMASFRLEIFEYGCGGRMMAFWDDWGILNDDDLSSCCCVLMLLLHAVVAAVAAAVAAVAAATAA